jgi:hypothetical protein
MEGERVSRDSSFAKYGETISILWIIGIERRGEGYGVEKKAVLDP